MCVGIARPRQELERNASPHAVVERQHTVGQIGPEAAEVTDGEYFGRRRRRARADARGRDDRLSAAAQERHKRFLPAPEQRQRCGSSAITLSTVLASWTATTLSVGRPSACSRAASAEIAPSASACVSGRGLQPVIAALLGGSARASASGRRMVARRNRSSSVVRLTAARCASPRIIGVPVPPCFRQIAEQGSLRRMVDSRPARYPLLGRKVERHHVEA